VLELPAGIVGVLELPAGIMGVLELTAGIMGVLELTAGNMGVLELIKSVPALPRYQPATTYVCNTRSCNTV
jgi:hypothetical protein